MIIVCWSNTILLGTYSLSHQEYNLENIIKYCNEVIAPLLNNNTRFNLLYLTLYFTSMLSASAYVRLHAPSIRNVGIIVCNVEETFPLLPLEWELISLSCSFFSRLQPTYSWFIHVNLHSLVRRSYFRSTLHPSLSFSEGHWIHSLFCIIGGETYTTCNKWIGYMNKLTFIIKGSHFYCMR